MLILIIYLMALKGFSNLNYKPLLELPIPLVNCGMLCTTIALVFFSILIQKRTKLQLLSRLSSFIFDHSAHSLCTVVFL